MPQPLAGVRVLDLTHWWSGPEATTVLAGLGADVIKVEAAQRPDPARAAGGKDPDSDPLWYERTALFNGVNAGKRGITLDLSRSEGRSLFTDLVRGADVVIDNFSARVMMNLGFAHDQLVAINPRIVTVNMTSFGLTGPWRDLVGFAYVFEQLSGAAALTGYEGGPPATMGGASDPSAGYVGALAVLVGLLERDRTGDPQHFDLSQTEAMAAFLGGAMIEAQVDGVVPERRGNRHPIWAPHNVYRCSGEDEWIALAVRTDAEWERFVAVLGSPEWATSEELSTAGGRKAHEGQLDADIGRWTSNQDKASLASRLVEARLPVGELLNPDEVEDDPQLRFRGTFQRVLRDPVGELNLPVIPLRLSEAERDHQRPAPRLGEHNREVLSELLGLTDDEIAKLELESVVGTVPL